MLHEVGFYLYVNKLLYLIILYFNAYISVAISKISYMDKDDGCSIPQCVMSCHVIQFSCTGLQTLNVYLLYSSKVGDYGIEGRGSNPGRDRKKMFFCYHAEVFSGTNTTSNGELYPTGK
jgi:hypothetical protein